MDYFSNYDRKCKDTQGGIKKVYLLPYVYYNETLIKSDGMQLTEFPESYVYEFDVEGSYTQNSTIEQGNVSFTHSVTIDIPKVYTFFDINAFVRNDFRVIVLTNNNQYIIFGTNNGLVATLSNATGNEKGEYNGFTVTFDGLEEKTGLLIDSLNDFFYVVFNNNVFNYNLNFNII